DEIEARGKTAILAGGTGFYLRAMVKPLFTSPRTNPDLRDRLIRIREKHGPIFLHRLLKRLDPATAEVLKPRDWSRTMRAIEVRLQTGRRLSEIQGESEAPPEPASRLRVICLNPNRDLLYARINERADRMFERGLVEEVQSLIESGVPSRAKAFQAHGYRRVVEHLQGLRSRDEALNQMKLDTRHYAKRQLSWWRAWDGVYWINRFGEEPEALVEALGYLAS
ncbi:MAG TPA: tRNA (adenosine(37)-N6)-dimethylallyltransferase MiaA, partial [Blastocatellia bacterium]|nr:tRNA (adenosine(37)-N6)-dimethylallyltransferase MiaA [Blastocatellia bacterium]